MVTALVEAVTLTYIIIDIYIIILGINISSKYPLPTAPRACVSCTSTTVSL